MFELRSCLNLQPFRKLELVQSNIHLQGSVLTFCLSFTNFENAIMIFERWHQQPVIIGEKLVLKTRNTNNKSILK